VLTVTGHVSPCSDNAHEQQVARVHAG